MAIDTVDDSVRLRVFIRRVYMNVTRCGVEILLPNKTEWENFGNKIIRCGTGEKLFVVRITDREIQLEHGSTIIAGHVRIKRSDFK